MDLRGLAPTAFDLGHFQCLIGELKGDRPVREARSRVTPDHRLGFH
jgi:hypothetical protein